MNEVASTYGVPNCREGYAGLGVGVTFAGVYMEEKPIPNSGENLKMERECYIIGTLGGVMSGN